MSLQLLFCKHRAKSAENLKKQLLALFQQLMENI